jgi:hypothetical protein
VSPEVNAQFLILLTSRRTSPASVRVLGSEFVMRPVNQTSDRQGEAAGATVGSPSSIERLGLSYMRRVASLASVLCLTCDQWSCQRIRSRISVSK